MFVCVCVCVCSSLCISGVFCQIKDTHTIFLRVYPLFVSTIATLKPLKHTSICFVFLQFLCLVVIFFFFCLFAPFFLSHFLLSILFFLTQKLKKKPKKNKTHNRKSDKKCKNAVCRKTTFFSLFLFYFIFIVTQRNTLMHCLCCLWHLMLVL